MNLKERIENNPVVWLLGILLAGFLSGIGAYKGLIEFTGQKLVSEDRLLILESSYKTQANAASPHQINSVSLPKIIDDEKDKIIKKITTDYNDNDHRSLYSMFGPMAKANVSKSTFMQQLSAIRQFLGDIKSNYFVNHVYNGQQGLYRIFTLNYFAEFENAERGYISIQLITDDNGYQLFALNMNKIG